MRGSEPSPTSHVGSSVTGVGLGATGSALAASLSLQGWRVTLYDRNSRQVDRIRSQGGVRITGDLGQSVVPVAEVTSDLGVAMREPLVLVSIRQNGHQALAEAMASLIRDDHTVLLLSGGGGSLEMVHLWRACGVGVVCCLGETSAPGHSARVLENGTVAIRLPPRRRTLRVAAFPADQTPRLMARIQGLFHLRPARHVLEVALCNVNMILHPLPMLLNLGAIERRRGDFALLAEGMTPGVFRALDAHDEERMRLLGAVGVDSVPVDVLFEELGLDPREYRESRPAPPFFDRIQDRFLMEDVPYGTVFMASLGRLLDVSTPVSDAIVQLASCVHGEPYATTGRICGRLGIAGLGRDQLQSFLMHGTALTLEPRAVGHA